MGFHNKLKNYLSKRSPGLQKDKSTIFKIQVICAYTKELQERPEKEELLDVLRLRYSALVFELQDTLINIHDNIDDSGILPCEKINEFQTLLESSLKYFIVNNPETGQTERFNDCLEVHFPASFIGHLERNIANNNYYLVDEQHPEKQVSLSSSQTHEERKEAIPLFAETLASLLSQNQPLITTVCQYINPDMGVALTSILQSLLKVLLGSETIFRQGAISLDTVITRQKTASDDPMGFIVTMAFLAHPVLDNIFTETFGNMEALEQYRTEWSQTRISTEVRASIHASTPKTVRFDPLTITLNLP